MNAQEIKNILIAYLKAANREIRIYQEKSIGDAVCDLMAVTDCLTGYEIKSDLDNYRRLDHQITAYDRFFEKCYIVVGDRHLKSAGQKVPDHWGIITIQSDHIIVNRTARAGNPTCASQLSVLWKLELTNLLTKTGLPLYTYKSKQYIIDRIVKHLDKAEIKRHVTYELMHRDYTLFNAKDYSLHFNAVQTEDAVGTVSGLPAAEIVDALSEQNLEKMTLDHWIALYAQAKKLQKSKEDLRRARTALRTPHDIPYTDIEVSLGVPWISEGIIDDFSYVLRTGDETLAEKRHWARKQVSYEPLTGLMKQGIPSKEIAFIHSCHSEAEKVQLFEKVNRGTVRVLLGSTFKLGIGANVQTRLKAICQRRCDFVIFRRTGNVRKWRIKVCSL